MIGRFRQACAVLLPAQAAPLPAADLPAPLEAPQRFPLRDPAGLQTHRPPVKGWPAVARQRFQPRSQIRNQASERRNASYVSPFLSTMRCGYSAQPYTPCDVSFATRFPGLFAADYADHTDEGSHMRSSLAIVIGI